MKEHVSKLWPVYSCILGLGGVRVGISTLLQGISNTKLSKTHTCLTEKQRKKDNSAGSKTVWNQGENLAVICVHAVCMNLKKSYSQTSVDSEERYNWFKHKNTCVHVHNHETYPEN